MTFSRNCRQFPNVSYDPKLDNLMTKFSTKDVFEMVLARHLWAQTSVFFMAFPVGVCHHPTTWAMLPSKKRPLESMNIRFKSIKTK